MQKAIFWILSPSEWKGSLKMLRQVCLLRCSLKNIYKHTLQPFTLFLTFTPILLNTPHTLVAFLTVNVHHLLTLGPCEPFFSLQTVMADKNAC